MSLYILQCSFIEIVQGTETEIKKIVTKARVKDIQVIPIEIKSREVKK